MKSLFLFIVFNISMQFQCFACDCGAWPGFCQAFQNEKEYSIVVLARVISHYDYGAYIEVIENIYGNSNKDTVIVWGDPGHFCRAYPGDVGDTLVYILQDCGGFYENENPLDFAISSCGAHKLKYQNGLLIGNYTSPHSQILKDTLSYNTFVEEIGTCEFLSNYDGIDLKISISPNPSGNLISINSLELINEISICDFAGKKLFVEKADNTSFDLDLTKYGMSSGIYVVILNMGNGTRVVRKIVYAGE